MLDVAVHKVVGVEPIETGLFFLLLERNGMEFDPGDCVALHTDAGRSRPYSIASGREGETLRFVIREMEGGEVSPWLACRKPGAEVGVSPPFGWFRPGQHADGGASVFIATGTGIAPFLAYRESFPLQPPAALLFGARTFKGAAGLDGFEGWCRLQLALSRERHPAGHHGRVTDLLDEIAMPPDTHYYLCGLESMIRDVGDRLQARGVDLLHIHREVFFHG